MAVYSEADENSLHVRFADEDICIGRRPQRRELPERAGDHQRGRDHRRRRDSPRLRLPVGERLSGRSLRGLPHPLHRSRPARHPPARRQVEGAARDEEGGRCRCCPAATARSRARSARLKVAKDIGYPVIIKAVAGGGGRGMRIVKSPGELPHAFRTAQREAEAAFGDGDVYVEKLPGVAAPHRVPGSRRPPRQRSSIWASASARFSAGTRSCSRSRRRRRSPTRCAARWARSWSDAARAVQYTNAGTFEFLMDDKGHFYFMEVNTRVQVEHPVTELVTGLDIVKEQIRIAAGERLSVRQSEVTFTGHATRVPHQRRGSRDVRAVARRHPRVLDPGRARACASTRPRTPSARSRRTTIR